MITISEYQACSTAGVRQLDLQLIAQIQKIAPGLLVKFDHLPVAIGAGCHPYLQAPAVKALERAIASRAKKMHVNSAYRTLAQQAVLYSHYRRGRCGIRAAAAPGSSNHNTARAIDLEDAMGWMPFLEAQKWDWIGSFDPMHFDFIGGGCKDLRHLSILAFQQLWNANRHSSKLVEDGCYGQATERALMQTLCTGFSLVDTVRGSIEAASSDLKPKIRFLRRGDRGPSVGVLQKALCQKGFNVEIDENFGALTAAAVRGFQHKHGLVSDGVVGMATSVALGLA